MNSVCYCTQRIHLHNTRHSWTIHTPAHTLCTYYEEYMCVERWCLQQDRSLLLCQAIEGAMLCHRHHYCCVSASIRFAFSVWEEFCETHGHGARSTTRSSSSSSTAHRLKCFIARRYFGVHRTQRTHRTQTQQNRDGRVRPQSLLYVRYVPYM